jgi:hypothetical protein
MNEESLAQLTTRHAQLSHIQDQLHEMHGRCERACSSILYAPPDQTLRKLAAALASPVRQAAAIIYWEITFQRARRLKWLRSAQLIAQSGLFDAAYYSHQNPEVQQSGIDPLEHYLDCGASQGRDPHPLFSTAYYLRKYPEVAASGLSPLVHYISMGAARGYTPNPLFDSSYYLERNPDVAAAGISPLTHYLRWGAREGRDPHPLFDTSYYLERNPDVAAAEINPLVHYIEQGAFEKRDPHPLFDTSYYLKKNPGIATAGINPLLHYWEHGAFEGKCVLSAERIAAHLAHSREEETSQVQLLSEGQAGRPIAVSSDGSTVNIGIYCSSIGNYFMGEIADLLAAAFRRIGIEALRLSENDKRPGDLNYDIIVAPHEFFYLGNGPSWAEDKAWLGRTIMVNVEQPQTSWFSRSYNFLRQARLQFDINLASTAVLRSIGVPAYFLPLGYLSDYQQFGFHDHRPDLLALKGLPENLWNSVTSLESSFGDRPIDLLFIGYLSPRREEFLAKNASWLSQIRCCLHIPPLTGPMLQGKGNALTTEAVAGLSQRSKIFLNIHQSDLRYFEWHRIVCHGLWQKTLVITEPCYRIPGLIPGEHYVESTLEDMGAKIEWLLTAPEGRNEAERIRQTGHQALKTHFSLEKIIANAFTLIVKSPAIS